MQDDRKAHQITLQELGIIPKEPKRKEEVRKQYAFPCGGAHYTITIMDRVQHIAVQKRRQYQTAIQNAIRARKPARAQTYKDKERELADDIQARAKMLKEKYGEYTEE